RRNRSQARRRSASVLADSLVLQRFADVFAAIVYLRARDRDLCTVAYAVTERFAGRGDDYPDLRDAKIGADLHSRRSGAARTNHGPHWFASGAKQSELQSGGQFSNARSEERRVGKECR